jgi:alpha-mannosidase
MKNVRRFGFVVFGLLAAIFSGPAQTVRPRDYTAHLIGHAHVDLSWLWRWEETVKDVAVRTFAGTLARMAEMPDLTFAQSQAALYEAIEKSDPALFEAIRVRVREGTWIPVGGMWVEPDLNMADGEALARQLLYGKRYFQEKFGLDVKVGWNPDSFGHNLQLPQMLAKAGVPYYVLGRGVPAGTTAFWWEGKGGARILCYVPPGWYNVSLKDGLRSIIAEAARTSPLKDYLVLYGEGDHGGGPRDSDLALIRSAKRDRAMPRTAFAAPEAYFRLLEKQRPDLAVVRSELNPVFPGCYTTQASTKRDNRRGESLLVEAEKFSALAVAGGFRDYYPERDLDEAWKIILRNQFHDILAGSSIGPVYDETAQFYREAFTRGRRALDFSLETIANGVDTRGEGVPVVVFNSLAWERTEPVTVEIPFAGPFRIVDSRGGDTPYQAVSGGGGSSRNLRRVVFTAEGVPSLGYRTYRLEQVDRDPVFKSTVAAGPEMLENEFFKITLDPKRGWITNLYDKANGREALYGPANVLQAVFHVGLGARLERSPGLDRRGGGKGRSPGIGSRPGRRPGEFRVPRILVPAGDHSPFPDAPLGYSDELGLAGAERDDQSRVPVSGQGRSGRIRNPLRIDHPAGRRRRGAGDPLDRCLRGRRQLRGESPERQPVWLRRARRDGPVVRDPGRGLSGSGSRSRAP